MRMEIFENLDMSFEYTDQEELELEYKKSEEGNYHSSYFLSTMIEDSVSVNIKEASHYLELAKKYRKRAIDQGHPEVLLDEALKLEREGNENEALTYFEKAEQNGMIEARIWLAYLKAEEDPLGSIELLLTTREEDDPEYEFVDTDRESVLLIPGEDTYNAKEIIRLFGHHPPRVLAKIFQKLAEAGKMPQPTKDEEG